MANKALRVIVNDDPEFWFWLEFERCLRDLMDHDRPRGACQIPLIRVECVNCDTKYIQAAAIAATACAHCGGDQIEVTNVYEEGA